MNEKYIYMWKLIVFSSQSYINTFIPLLNQAQKLDIVYQRILSLFADIFSYQFWLLKFKRTNLFDIDNDCGLQKVEEKLCFRKEIV